MITIKIIFIYILLTKPSLASNNCTDETPWLCEFEETLDEKEENEENFARIYGDVAYQYIQHHGRRIPKEFDSRKAWPYCKSISTILNQGKCNTCWAFCSTPVMSDRTCIATGGKKQPLLSPHNIITCCEGCLMDRSKLCDRGGYTLQAFKYFVKRGVVTSECQPYSTKPLQSSNVSCKRSCSNRRINYSKDIHRGSYIVKHSRSTKITDVLIEIMKSGPLCASMRNYTKTFSKEYKKGVYIGAQNSEKRVVHIVRLIGWGTEKGIPYWLVANSWGTKWGDKGFFKIRRGTNELGIEEQFFAVGIKPLKNQKNYFGKGVGNQISSAQYIQPWKFILYSMYSIYLLIII